jgi:hypothetical protein
MHPGSFLASQAEAIITQKDFHRVAQGGNAQHLDFFTLQDTHLQQPLDKGIASLDRFDPGSLAHVQLVHGGHGQEFLGRSLKEGGNLTGSGQRSHEDPGSGFTAQAQATAANTEQARAALPQDLELAARAQAELGHAAHPAGPAHYFFHFGPFPGLNQIQGEQHFGVHNAFLCRPPVPVGGTY